MNYKPPLAQKIAIGYGLALGILVVISLASVRSIEAILANSHTIERSQELVHALEATASAIKDVETAQRGYVLTFDSNYLQPYLHGTRTVSTLLGRLSELTDHNPAQQQRLTALLPALQRRLAVAQNIIDTRRNQGFSQALTIIRTNTAQALTDQIRGMVSDMQNAEQAELESVIASAADRGRMTLHIISFGNSAAFVLIALSALAITRDLTRREEIAQHMVRTQYRLERSTNEQMADIRRMTGALEVEGVQRHRAEQELQRLDAHYRRLLDALVEGVFAFDRHGLCTYINRPGAEILGYTVDQLLGRNIHNLIHADSGVDSRCSPTDCPLLQNANRLECVWIDDGRFRRRDGRVLSVRYLLLTTSLRATQESIVIFNDASPHRRLEQQLRNVQDINGSLNLRNSEFLQSLAMELGSRLESTLLHAGLAMEASNKDSATLLRAYVTKIVAETAGGLERLDEIGELARFEAGKLSLGWESFDIVATVRDVFEQLRQDLDQRGNSMLLTTPTPAIDFVRGDLQKIRTCLRNLVLFVNRLLNDTPLHCVISEELKDATRWVKIAVTGSTLAASIDRQALLYRPFDYAGQHGFRHQEFGVALAQRYCDAMSGRLVLGAGPDHLFTLSLPIALALPRPELVLRDGTTHA